MIGMIAGFSCRAMAVTGNDSIVPPRYSYELKVNPGTVLATDKYVKKWLKEKKTWAVAAELHYTPQPVDNDDFAKDYNYPTFSVGLRYSFNHGTTMHREADPDWGQLVPVDYDSQLGNVLTLYGTFSRPLYRNRHWELAYFLGGGVGYSHKTYNKTDEIDNELIGSHLNIYFTAGASATYRINRNWGIKAGIDFSHHSNGALYRPNKGTNYFGPFMGLVYYGQDRTDRTSPSLSREGREKGLPDIGLQSFRWVSVQRRCWRTGSGRSSRHHRRPLTTARNISMSILPSRCRLTSYTAMPADGHRV